MQIFGKKVTFPFLKTRLGILMTVALSLVFMASVGLDQASKRHAHATLMGWENPDDIQMYRSKTVPIVSFGSIPEDPETPGFFLRLNFQYQRNTGAAFSMFSDWDDSIRVPFFYGVTVLAVCFIFYYLKTLPLNFHLTRFGLIMILSGAMGNFIDRVLLGYVIDFVDVDWVLYTWHHDFAVFNVADIAINIGIIAFLLESLLPKKPLMVSDIESSPQAQSAS
jgi:signal peptidase II